MSAQEIRITKKLGRPVGRVKPAATTVRMYRDTLEQIDAWIAEQSEPRPSRPEAIHRIVEGWFASRVREAKK